MFLSLFISPLPLSSPSPLPLSPLSLSSPLPLSLLPPSPSPSPSPLYLVERRIQNDGTESRKRAFINIERIYHVLEIRNVQQSVIKWQ
jgi:hypothetical protein